MRVLAAILQAVSRLQCAMRFLALAILFVSVNATAQVYRWIDKSGTVNYSNEPPPAGAKASELPIDARPGPPSAQPQDCYTVRCQGERMEDRLARRDAAEAQAQAERTAVTPPRPRGLEFRRYIAIQRGMSEGEMLGIAGPPDLAFRDFTSHTYTYLPIPGEPFTTTITVISGRVSELERVRKF
jgi:hypothetical protein